jgi:hypothetical protein
MSGTVSMKSNQQVVLTARGNDPDQDGQPNPLPSAPSWSILNGTVVSISPSADGLTCTVHAVGGAGTATVRCTVSGLPVDDTTVVVTLFVPLATAVVVTAGTPTP